MEARVSIKYPKDETRWTEKMNIEEKLDTINSQMVAFMRGLPTNEGMREYYDLRAWVGEILSAEERLVIKYIWQNFRDNTSIVEMAAGLGQLGIALKMLGFHHITVCETSRERYELCGKMHEGISSPINVYRSRWQGYWQDHGGLYVTVNAVSSGCSMELDRELMQSLLNKGTDIIFCPELYGAQGPKEHGLEADTITQVNDRIFHFHKAFHRE